MTDTIPIRYKLENISPRAYEHPADRAATAALRSIPMLDSLIGRLTELQYERAFRQLFLGNSVKIGPEQLPHIWDSYLHVLDTLDMPDVYDLYITQTPIANAFVMGVSQPMIVINSGIVDLLNPDELESVLAHEVGHILSEHVTYRTALLILIALGSVGVPALAGLPLMALRLALLEWYRAAELSADRAATLVVRDPLIFCRGMMHMAGGPAAQNLNLDAFIKQANDYESAEDGLDKGLRFFLELGVSHPFPVRRVSELMKWVQSGDFDRIIRGEYAKRDEKHDPRQDMADAADFYRERFADLMGGATDGMRDWSQQVSDWLRSNKK
ncbi:MAG: M48 family metallopeptidase [Chloroflexota bacterium]|nr:M48 family metallopeptidase [Chloroflexota bacterium]